MVNTQVAQFLQGLRGAQGVVVLLYLAVRRGLYLDDIEQACGISNEAATSAVKSLRGKGMLVRSVGEHGKAFYSPVSETFDQLLPVASLFLPEQNPVLPDSELVAGGASIGLIESSTIAPPTTTKAAQNPVKPDSGRGKPDKVIWSVTSTLSEEEVAENQAALKECNIYGRKLEVISRLEWVTPEYIRAQVGRALSEADKWDRPLGMACYYMEQNYPVQELRTNSHLTTCTCKQCVVVERNSKGNRYSNSEYFNDSRQDLTGDPDDLELLP